jgi:hypothetical protein
MIAAGVFLWIPALMIAVLLGTMVLREPFSARIALACGVVLAGAPSSKALRRDEFLDRQTTRRPATNLTRKRMIAMTSST